MLSYAAAPKTCKSPETQMVSGLLQEREKKMKMIVGIGWYRSTSFIIGAKHKELHTKV